MIWSFIKFGIFLAIAAALAFGVTYVMDTRGEVRIAFGGQELSLTPLVFLLLIAAAFIAFYVILKLVGLIVAVLKFVNGDETAVSRYFDKNRERKGFDALSDSMIALASGDGKTAMSKAARAERYLERRDLTRLVTAQAAQISGNKDRAQQHFKELLKSDRTRFVGVQGLMKQKLEEGDTDTALALAKKAFSINPSDGTTVDTLFKLQTEKSDWAGARDTLQARVRRKMLPKDVGKRRDAVLNLAHAQREALDGDVDNALEAARAANAAAPGLIPAAVLLASLKTQKGDSRKAAAILTKAWAQNPHPDIAAAFAAIAPGETAEERIKRFKPLLRSQPAHAETRMLEAELYIAAEDFPAARKALGDLAEADPTARSLAILAAVERGSGADETTVSGFLARAISAPRGAAWVCGNCRHVHGDWAPVCSNCDSFDTLAWTEAPLSEDTKTMAAAMLPLIVGQIPQSQEDTDVEPEAGSADDADIEDAEIAADDAAEDAVEADEKTNA